jgi:broad specificity phosphatase PhoE
MARIYIVRHGETEWNAEGRIQGHTDIGLSDRGREQAQATARRLAEVPFAVAYSSDMSRTRDTARIILGERDIPLHSVPELREYHKGVFEGLTVQQYRQRYPEQYRASLVNDPDFAPTGGETIRQSTARLTEFVAGLGLTPGLGPESASESGSESASASASASESASEGLRPEDDVLIVGHGGSLRSCIVALLQLPLEANWKFVMQNCALSVIHTYPDNAVLHLYNDTSHLNGL